MLVSRNSTATTSSLHRSSRILEALILASAIVLGLIDPTVALAQNSGRCAELAQALRTEYRYSEDTQLNEWIDSRACTEKEVNEHARVKFLWDLFDVDGSKDTLTEVCEQESRHTFKSKTVGQMLSFVPPAAYELLAHCLNSGLVLRATEDAEGIRIAVSFSSSTGEAYYFKKIKVTPEERLDCPEELIELEGTRITPGGLELNCRRRLSADTLEELDSRTAPRHRWRTAYPEISVEVTASNRKGGWFETLFRGERLVSKAATLRGTRFFPIEWTLEGGCGRHSFKCANDWGVLKQCVDCRELGICSNAIAQAGYCATTFGAEYLSAANGARLEVRTKRFSSKGTGGHYYTCRLNGKAIPSLSQRNCKKDSPVSCSNPQYQSYLCAGLHYRTE